jgi:flagellar assembly protein FliH
MSSRARREVRADLVAPFEWSTPQAKAAPEQAPQPPPQPAIDLEKLRATVERDAFLKGYAQGERAGAEAASTRGEGMLRRLKETLEELTTLRAEMLHRSERQLVQLALAIAKRVVQREVSLDRAVLVGMARAAIDRLGDHAQATIRLHPDDYAQVAPGLKQTDDAHVRVEPDPLVSRGSCLVQSDFGFMDVTPEAQFEELARTLLEDRQPETVGVRARGAGDAAAR